jgi:hypothetical protein
MFPIEAELVKWIPYLIGTGALQRCAGTARLSVRDLLLRLVKVSGNENATGPCRSCDACP